jgi:hypothetical protein
MLSTIELNAKNVAYIALVVMFCLVSHTVPYIVPSILNVVLDTLYYIFIVHIDSKVSKMFFHPLIQSFPFKPLQSIEDLAATMLDSKMLGTME